MMKQAACAVYCVSLRNVESVKIVGPAGVTSTCSLKAVKLSSSSPARVQMTWRGGWVGAGVVQEG